MAVTTCAECGAAMEAGFVADAGSDTIRPGEWVSGAPERSWFTGTRVRGKVRAPLTALRCSACGLVKLYAFTPDAAVTPYLELAARVDQLEAELTRLAERERFLVELLQRRAALPAGEGAAPADGEPRGDAAESR
jgi:hypothetical protein